MIDYYFLNFEKKKKKFKWCQMTRKTKPNGNYHVFLFANVCDGQEAGAKFDRIVHTIPFYSVNRNWESVRWSYCKSHAIKFQWHKWHGAVWFTSDGIQRKWASRKKNKMEFLYSACGISSNALAYTLWVIAVQSHLNRNFVCDVYIWRSCAWINK